MKIIIGRADGKIFLKITAAMFLLLFALLVVFSNVDKISIETFVNPQLNKKIIIDAGHAALENTIKTPKNHRQANVEIIPKTRLNSGFSPFLNCLISRSIINLQIQKIQ